MYSQAHKEIRLNGLAAREGGKLQAKRIEKNQLQHLKIVDCAFLTSKKNVKKKKNFVCFCLEMCHSHCHCPPPPSAKKKLQQDKKGNFKTFELYICIDHEYTGCRKKYRQPIFVILKCALPHLPPHLPPPPIFTQMKSFNYYANSAL